MKKMGLGKGLDALFGDDIATKVEPKKEEVEKGLLEVKLTDVEPNKEQPRKNFDEEKIALLAESIKENGLIQPIVVRKENNKYKIIAGERRWRAARVAGMKKVPIIIKEASDEQVLQMALIENIQRQDLNSIEEAMAFKYLVEEYGMTQNQVAQKVGRSRPGVANIIRLLNLCPKVQDMIVTGRLSEGQAKTLLSIEDPDLQYEIALEVEKRAMTVRDVESLIHARTQVKKGKKLENVFTRAVEERIKEYLGTKVKVRSNSKDKGRIVIEYYSNDELERILETMGVNKGE